MENYEEIKVKFINKYNEEKEVEFYIDEQTMDILNKSDLSKEEKDRYLKEKYHEFELEKYYKRRYELYEENVLEEINYQKTKLTESNSDKQIELLDLEEALNFLTDRQKLIIDLVYFKGMSQQEVASFLGVSKQAINSTLKRIYSILRKKIKKFNLDIYFPFKPLLISEEVYLLFYLRRWLVWILN